VATGCPEKEYESDRVRLRGDWGIFWASVVSAGLESDNIMLAGLDAGTLAPPCEWPCPCEWLCSASQYY
jgi:hypothetical protein